MAKRILVCGGRDFQDWQRAYAVLDKYQRETAHEALTVIVGAANGADRLAADWCMSRMVPFDSFPAEWRKHGKAAGPIRNQRMLDEGKPDLVVAFPGGRGTEDMVRRAQAAGVPVERIQ